MYTLHQYITFSEAADVYFNIMRNQRKASTIETDIKTLKLLGDINNMQIDLIKSNTIQKLLYDMDKKGCSLSYINKLYTTIGKIFKYAVKENIISENPMDKVVKITRPNDVKNDVIKFWTPTEFNIFINLVDDLQYYTLFNFLYHTGCRKGEALALTWKDIDFHKKTFHINKTCTQQIKGVPFMITPPKTPNSNRTKRMSDKLTAIMQDWYDHCSNLYGFSDDCFVFGTLDRPLPTSNLERHFKKYRGYADGWIQRSNVKIGDLIEVEKGDIRNDSKGSKLRDREYEGTVIIDSVSNDPSDLFPYHVKLPISDIPIHGLRHSHATLLINNIKNGANIKTYAHLFQETEDELIDILEKNV